MNDTTQLRRFFSEGQWLFALLCFLTFLAVLTTGHNVFDNAWLIFGYEAVFVVAFLCTRGREWYSGRLFPTKSVGFWLLAAWFVSITISLINSPYGLMTQWFAVQRYFQTIFHILFFLCVRSFLTHYQRSIYPLFLSYGVSVFVLALIFIGAWQGVNTSQDLGRLFWFREPPRNAHIRITGFLVTGATTAMAPYFLYRAKRKVELIGLLVVGMCVWGFMFWCSGRGSIFSAIFACAALAIFFKLKKQPVARFISINILLMLGGIILAELFKVFDWNGIFNAASRTAAAGGDIYKLSTGRTKLWGQVWASIQHTGSYLFGLGPQGYCYMPNRTFAFQPHNLVFQFLAEWGIIGAILFLMLLMIGFYHGLKNQVFRPAGTLPVSVMAAGAVIIALGLHSLVDGIFYHAQPSLLMAIAFAVWTQTRQQNRIDISHRDN